MGNRLNGLHTLIAGASLVAAGLASLLTWQLIGVWPLLFAALIAYGGFRVIRRATLS